MLPLDDWNSPELVFPPPVLLPLNLLSTFQLNCLSGPVVLKVNVTGPRGWAFCLPLHLLFTPTATLGCSPGTIDSFSSSTVPLPSCLQAWPTLVPLCGTPPAPAPVPASLPGQQLTAHSSDVSLEHLLSRESLVSHHVRDRWPLSVFP